MMKVEIARTQHPDLSKALTLIEVDDEFTIEVIGFSTGEAKWKVSGEVRFATESKPIMDILDSEVFNNPTPEDGWRPIGDLGRAFVWMEPTTWAHAISNMLQNC
jgi:hypothetical protein